MQLSVQGSLVRFTSAVYWGNGTWNDLTTSTGATLSVTITNIDGTSVTNASNLAMSQDAGTSNNWSLVVPSTVTLVSGNLYWVALTVVIGTATVQFKNKFSAEYETGDSTPS